MKTTRAVSHVLLLVTLLFGATVSTVLYADANSVNGNSNGNLIGNANTKTVWIDVRSELEHKADRIEGDIRITHTDIVEEVGKLFPNKNTPIQLYCRSGNRAGKAMTALKDAGYTQVENVGGIDTARSLRFAKEEK